MTVFLLSVLVVFLFLRLKEREEFYKKKHKEGLNRQRAVIRGSAVENIAPWVMDLGCELSSLRPLGSPVDWVGFSPYDGDEPMTVHLIEVKTGKAGLSKRERRVRDAVEAGRVEYRVVRFDKSV